MCDCLGTFGTKGRMEVLLVVCTKGNDSESGLAIHMSFKTFSWKQQKTKNTHDLTVHT